MNDVHGVYAVVEVMMVEEKITGCGDRGFKSLAAKFRAYVNAGAGEPGEDILAYYDLRVKLAQQFFREEGIDPCGHLAHELCHHKPVLLARGGRRCWTCLK